MHIFLIGLPGSGKTTLGKQLALELKLPFIDTDKRIEQTQGKSIERIFAEDGEPAFRQLEHNTLLTISKEDSSVISLGGGTPCFLNNMELIKSSGQSIFLDVSPEELCKRMLGDGQQQRPMLKGKKENEVLEFLTQKRAERLAFYSQSDYQLKHDHIRLEDVLHMLHRN
ncbi:MAG: shikimate kinase [Cytophagaceae bacterium]|jgi:shikimate kinase|nr:shikimate kinase [Cytophagaceae bacterium]